jgi:HAD superfamily hydrolase (TIGR01459 family)
LPGTYPLPRFIRGLAELAEDFDLLLCDVWGVLHDGCTAYPGAVDALRRFRAKGGKVVLITNAPAPSRIVRGQLAKIGVPDDSYDAIVSSGDVTLSLLLAKGESAFFPLGYFDGTDLCAELCRLSGAPPRIAPLEEADFVLCTVFLDPDHEKPEDYDDVLAQIMARKLDMICANPDIVVQQKDKLYYCAGAVAERYAAMGGAVIMAGKPFAPIYAAAFFASMEAPCGTIDRSRVLVIGDAMRTDIKGAADQNLASLFVTSGIHRDELHPGGTLDTAACRQFIEAADVTPSASIAELTW